MDVVLTGRRSFRRLPPGRIDIGAYHLADPSTSDATYSTRAAVIEGWQFEPAAFGIDKAAYTAADPAHWLALETAARALAAAGLPAGTGLDRDRTGVIIGNTLAGDTSRANGLRVRWPYVRRVLADALGTGEIPAEWAGTVLQRAESSYLAPFPPMGPYSLAGSMPGTIAAAISTYFGFRGGSHAVDSDCSSSLQAVASACAALVTGELDAAIAGGVDLSLDPLELIGLAKAGLLATSDVRIYDEVPSWGTSGGGMPGEPQSHASSQLLAMQRAYERGGVDPADIQFIEGNGAGTPLDDQAELTALNSIRAGARRTAALGSVKANIGHAKAAAGAAGLIKTVLALGTGVVPPATGVDRPHELIASGDARLVLPQAAQDWAAGTRLAAVSTMSLGGSNVHVVLRHEPASRGRQDRWLRSVPLLAKAAAAGRAGTDGAPPHPITGPEPTPFLVHAPDRFGLAAMLFRIAEIADGMSDAEMRDLACMLGRDPGQQGRARVAIVATRQEQLALLAREAIALLPQLADGLIAARPGVFASDDADGRVTLLLSGGMAGAMLRPGVMRSLDNLRWLDALDVNATAAVGHGLGALAGLAWAGVLGESEVVEIVKLREQFVTRSADRGRGVEEGTSTEVADSADDGRLSTRHQPATLRAAIAQRFRFGPPRRRLISTVTGAEISSVDDAIDLICNGLDGADRQAQAIAEGAIGASLLLETGPGSALVTAAADITDVPAISLQSGSGDRTDRALVAAALFAVGAMGRPQALFAGQRARPIDIWRDQIFITNPCQLVPQPRQADQDAAAGSAATEITDTEIADTEIADTQVIDTATADTDITATEIADTETTDTQIIDTVTETADTATAYSETTATEITDTEIADTQVIDTATADTETADTEAAGTATTEAEIT